MHTPETFYIPSTAEGKKLHTLVWDAASPRAVLQLVHGMAEHIGRYDEFARWMAERGVAVVGASHLGHGLSVGEGDMTGYFAKKDGWAHLVADVDRVRRFAQERYPDVPYFLLGHSMGSFIVRDYLTRDYAKGLAGAVIMGTADQPGAVLSAGGFLCRLCTLFQGGKHRSDLMNGISFGSYNKSFEPARTDFDWLSKNEANIDEYTADPLCGFCFTLSAFRDLFAGMKYIGKQANVNKVDRALPCLLISGEKDPVGDFGRAAPAVAEMFRRAGVTDVAVKLYPDARHELLSEPERETVFADILAFLEGHLG